MIWRFEKFKGDCAIYATCPKCKYSYSTTTAPNFKTGEYVIDIHYKYCPECGVYLYNNSEEINVIWNERDIVELYKG